MSGVTRTPDLSADAAIRQAVAFGKQAAVREILDMLREARRDAALSGWMPSTLKSKAQQDAYRRGERNGLDVAIGTVREYRIDPREEPT